MMDTQWRGSEDQQAADFLSQALSSTGGLDFSNFPTVEEEVYQDVDPWGLKQEPAARQNPYQQQQDPYQQQQQQDPYQQQQQDPYQQQQGWVRPQDVTGPQFSRRNPASASGAHQSWPEVALAKAINNSDGWACTDCQYRHRRRGYLLNHIEKEHMPLSFPGYECVRCTTVSTSRHNFQTHARSCRASPAPVPSHFHSDVEKRIAKMGPNFICTECEFTAESFDYLANHVTKDHATSLRKFESSSRVLMTEGPGMEQKQEPQATESSLTCNICILAFSAKVTWLRHMQEVHRTHFPFKCQLCDYKCNRRDQMKSHVDKIHKVKNELETPMRSAAPPSPATTGVRQGFKCKLCGVVFLTKDPLINHIKTVHSDVVRNQGFPAPAPPIYSPYTPPGFNDQISFNPQPAQTDTNQQMSLNLTDYSAGGAGLNFGLTTGFIPMPSVVKLEEPEEATAFGLRPDDDLDITTGDLEPAGEDMDDPLSIDTETLAPEAPPVEKIQSVPLPPPPAPTGVRQGFKCKLCGVIFLEKAPLINHIKTVHADIARGIAPAPMAPPEKRQKVQAEGASTSMDTPRLAGVQQPRSSSNIRLMPREKLEGNRIVQTGQLGMTLPPLQGARSVAPQILSGPNGPGHQPVVQPASQQVLTGPPRPSLQAVGSLNGTATGQQVYQLQTPNQSQPTKVLIPKGANIPADKLQAILSGTGDNVIMKGNKMYKPMFRCPFCTSTFSSLQLCSTHLNSKECQKVKPQQPTTAGQAVTTTSTPVTTTSPPVSSPALAQSQPSVQPVVTTSVPSTQQQYKVLSNQPNNLQQPIDPSKMTTQTVQIGNRTLKLVIQNKNSSPGSQVAPGSPAPVPAPAAGEKPPSIPETAAGGASISPVLTAKPGPLSIIPVVRPPQGPGQASPVARPSQGPGQASPVARPSQGPGQASSVARSSEEPGQASYLLPKAQSPSGIEGSVKPNNQTGQDGYKKVEQMSVDIGSKKEAKKSEKNKTVAQKEKPVVDISDEDEKVICEKCKMPFKDTKTLETHTKEFHRIDSFACRNCKKGFICDKSTYQDHIKKCLRGEAETFSCPVCQKKFISKENCAIHQREQRHIVEQKEAPKISEKKEPPTTSEKKEDVQIKMFEQKPAPVKMETKPVVVKPSPKQFEVNIIKARMQPLVDVSDEMLDSRLEEEDLDDPDDLEEEQEDGEKPTKLSEKDVEEKLSRWNCPVHKMSFSSRDKMQKHKRENSCGKSSFNQRQHQQDDQKMEVEEDPEDVKDVEDVGHRPQRATDIIEEEEDPTRYTDISEDVDDMEEDEEVEPPNTDEVEEDVMHVEERDAMEAEYDDEEDAEYFCAYCDDNTRDQAKLMEHVVNDHPDKDLKFRMKLPGGEGFSLFAWK